MNPLRIHPDSAENRRLTGLPHMQKALQDSSLLDRVKAGHAASLAVLLHTVKDARSMRRFIPAMALAEPDFFSTIPAIQHVFRKDPHFGDASRLLQRIYESKDATVELNNYCKTLGADASRKRLTKLLQGR